MPTQHAQHGLIGIGLAVVILALWAVAVPAMADGPGDPTAASGADLCYSGCGGVDAPVIREDFVQEVVEKVNAQRLAAGLGPLKRVDALDRSARYHATDMGHDNYFNHDTYDWTGGGHQYTCSTWDRIGGYYPGWGSLAENIAAGQVSPAEVMNTWMDSPGHRGNILSPDFWEIGVGYYEGSGAYYRYWVQNIGRRWDVYPLIINREAARTDSLQVTLDIYGTWDTMRLRNDNGAWSAWGPFQGTSAWTLAPGVGDHTVTVELRQESRSAVSSDTIYLTSSPPVATPTPTRKPGPMTPRVWLPMIANG